MSPLSSELYVRYFVPMLYRWLRERLIRMVWFGVLPHTSSKAHVCIILLLGQLCWATERAFVQ